MRAFITVVCFLGLAVCTTSLLALIANSLAVHDYHVVLTLLVIFLFGFFIATAQVING